LGDGKSLVVMGVFLYGFDGVVYKKSESCILFEAKGRSVVSFCSVGLCFCCFVSVYSLQ
jgi:hypothetical protein